MKGPQETLLVWLGSSKKDLMELPLDIRKFFGHALNVAQHGERHPAAKILKHFRSAGVLELVADDREGTYRAVYTVRFSEAIFVLHAFQKKSKRGISTAKMDMKLIRDRLKVAEKCAKEMRDA